MALFSVEINTQIRQALPELHNTSPSHLNQKIEINDVELNRNLNNFYQPNNNERSNKPKSMESVADSTSLDWNLETIA